MAYFLSPVLNEQQFDANGDPRAGALISTYLAGTLTATTTYKTSTGTAHTNPIQLDSSGNYPNGTQLWLLGGFAYKFVITDSDGSNSRTFDNITGVGDDLSGIDQWIVFAAAPTYISATSFSLVGDQTNTFQINRRVRTINGGGTVYSTITGSSFAAGVTTVTVVNDSGVLDSSISQVSYGLLSATNPSIPETSIGGALRVSTSAGAARDTLLIPAALRYYFSGFTLSTAGASATMSIAAGAAIDSTFTTSIIGAAIAKTTAAWAVGTAAGGLDTGAIANSTKYYFYVIRRPDTGVVDVVFSLNSSLPTLPANYTQYRYIGMGLTNGSAQWTKFLQLGRTFWWDVPPLDVNQAASTGSSTSYTISVPLGRRVEAKLNAGIGSSAGGVAVYIHCPDIATAAASLTAAPLGSPGADDNGNTNGQVVCLTSTSGQVAARANASDTLRIVTLGYTDTVGIDS